MIIKQEEKIHFLQLIQEVQSSTGTNNGNTGTAENNSSTTNSNNENNSTTNNQTNGQTQIM